MGVGCAKGEDRIEKALKEAIESPLMECSMQGAKGVLMNITCGSDLGIFEIQQAASYVEGIVSEDATFVWGCVEDPTMEGAAEIIVVATGFRQETSEPRTAQHTKAPEAAPRRQRTIPTIEKETQSEEQFTPVFRAPAPTVAETVYVSPQSHAPSWLITAEESQDMVKEDKAADILDTPTFVRRNKSARKPQIV